ncbi:MAG: phage integrase SAM-like domain-containing protein, partial [Planctomycetales bacterium]|nr:phage integrase SAM-like domain-containing protein [Planctomycetales bacterium]
MTSIINDKTKNSYIIRLSEKESLTGKRAKIFCGTLDKKQVQQVQLHVEHLISAKQSGTAIPTNTANWLGDLKGPLRKRLESLQLIIPEKTQTAITVVEYMEQVIANRVGKKPNTIRIYNRSLYFVKQFFGDCRLMEVTVSQAEKFKVFLLTPKRLDGGKTLCENTARKMLDKLKTVFNDAIKDELLTKNPFKGIASNVTGNAKRERFIEQATIEQVIEAAPDDEFAFIIALSRYGGLRTPSEFSLLKHGDFKLREEGSYFEVLAPKTEYCKPEPRIIPVFPELLPYVKKLVSTSKAKHSEFVFSDRYRTCTEA